MHLEPSERLFGPWIAADCTEEPEEVGHAPREHEIGAGRPFPRRSDRLPAGRRPARPGVGLRRHVLGRAAGSGRLRPLLRVRRGAGVSFLPHHRHAPDPFLRIPVRGQDAERTVPYLDLEAPAGAPDHEGEAPALGFAEKLRKVGVGGRGEGGDAAADPLEEQVDGGAHR